MINRAIRTGLASIDKITGGLRQGELFVLAGRAGVGKSALAMNIAVHAAIEEGVPAAVFSPKMPYHHVLRRLRLAHPGFLNASISRLANANLLVDDTCGLNLTDVTQRARRLRRDAGVRLVVIDYIQLIRRDKKFLRAEDTARISRLFRSLAEEIAVLVLCALPRLRDAGTVSFKNMSSLRTSLEKEADVVGLLSRKPEEVSAPDAGVAVSAILKIIRHKNSKAGEAFLKYRKDRYLFEDAAE